MIVKHCLKLAWNRKRENALVIVEIGVSFVVLFFLTLTALQSAANFRDLLGFSYEHVWSISVDPGVERVESEESATLEAQVRNLTYALRALPGVRQLSATMFVPYFGGMTSYTDDRIVGLRVDDAFKEVMGLNLVEGRWFEPEDDQLNWNPVVVSRKLAESRFGDESALGKVISPPGDAVQSRIIGVVENFRRNGDFSASEALGFWRHSLQKGLGSHDVIPYLLVKVDPSHSAAFAEEIMERLLAVAPQWSYEVDALADLRASYLSWRIAPLIAGGLVVGFLMLMVALGLFGVLWQTISKRRREIGLRIVHGATSMDVFSLIVLEVMAMTAIGVIAGTVLVSQVQLFEWVGSFEWATYTVSILLSALLIHGLTAICALYPSWLATRVHPVQSLHCD